MIDDDGRWRIPVEPRFKYVAPFRGGRALVYFADGDRVYIDDEGNTRGPAPLAPPDYGPDELNCAGKRITLVGRADKMGLGNFRANARVHHPDRVRLSQVLSDLQASPVRPAMAHNRDVSARFRPNSASYTCGKVAPWRRECEQNDSPFAAELEKGGVGVSKVRMDVFAPSAAQRRLLVELLANELDDEVDLRVADAARETALQQLVALGMVSRIHTWVTLTGMGRELAGQLADRMLGLERQLEGCA